MTTPASSQQQVKRSRSFVWLSATLVVFPLIATAPLIVSFAASAIANAAGCEITTMDVTSPCMIMGSEVSQGLTTLILMGYFAFYSLRLGAFLLAGWAIIACLVGLVCWLRPGRVIV